MHKLIFVLKQSGFPLPSSSQKSNDCFSVEIRVISEALELYYLQTRYYDPTVCRFISPDDADYLDPETIDGLTRTQNAF